MKAVPALQMEDKSTTHAPFGPTFVPEQHHEQVAFDAINKIIETKFADKPENICYYMSRIVARSFLGVSYLVHIAALLGKYTRRSEHRLKELHTS